MACWRGPTAGPRRRSAVTRTPSEQAALNQGVTVRRMFPEADLRLTARRRRRAITKRREEAGGVAPASQLCPHWGPCNSWRRLLDDSIWVRVSAVRADALGP